MKIAVFSTKPYDRRFLEEANEEFGHELTFFEPRLTPETARLAEGHQAVCAFVNDALNELVLTQLQQAGIGLVVLRCAGFNNVHLPSAQRLGIKVARVPAYSPYSVAEHAVGLILALNRKLHRAYNRVREGNFSLDGLLGFDLRGRQVGVLGTGKIGRVFAQIMKGFGCRVLAFDPFPNSELDLEYVTLDQLLSSSDVISLHCPLTKDSHHLLDGVAFAKMKKGVMVINTSRGALIDTSAAIAALKRGKLGSLGLDVYEEEEELFFEDHSDHVIADDVFARLLTFPNVLITGHQAFFTREALTNIASTTLRNASLAEQGRLSGNEVSID